MMQKIRTEMEGKAEAKKNTYYFCALLNI